MPEEPSELTHDIAENRNQLDKHLQELQSKVHEATDIPSYVETYVRRNPRVKMALAAVAGTVLVVFIVRLFRRD